MALTDTKIKNAKPKPDKAYKLYDEKGLFLLVAKNGSKWWRFKYMFGGRKTAFILHEQGFSSDIIERQLSHSERNTVKKADRYIIVGSDSN